MAICCEIAVITGKLPLHVVGKDGRMERLVVEIEEWRDVGLKVVAKKDRLRAEETSDIM